MEEKKWHQLLAGYLWQYRMTVLMFLAFTGIYALVFSLYELETEAVWYGAGLCVLLAFAVLSIHYIFYRKRYRERRRILQNIQLLIPELPEPRNQTEADYQDMVRALKRILDESVVRLQNERRDSMDYYTTWVHQIKTPISVMQMILQSEDTEEHKELSAELFRIEQYVEMVLSYLRLSSETSDFVFQEYELDGIIKQAVHKYAGQFVRRKLRLFYQPTNVRVLTDEKWLLFILEQLLSNAVKYTWKGSVTIEVTGDKMLKITDTGIGIAPEDLPRIFEKGFTGYNGRADKKSTGLGLYLCRTAAEKLSHRISVDSEPGVGTNVSVDLHTDKLEVE